MPIKFSQFTNRTSNTAGTTIVGFDGNQNIKILSSDLLSGFINGTPHTLPVFATANTLGDSIISQDASATQLFINGKVGIGRTLLAGGPNLEVYSTGNPFADIRSVQAGGSVSQGARIYLTAEDTLANKQGQVDINIHGPSHNTDAYSFEIANTSNPTSTTGGDIFFSSRPAGSTIELVRFKEDGQVQFNQYGQNTFTGTAAKNLAVDSSGNVIETGTAIGGSGTVNQVAKFTPDGVTIGNSQIFDNGTTVGINTNVPDSNFKLDVDGQIKSSSSSFPVYFLERETDITGDGTFTSPTTGIASGFHLRTHSSSTIQDGFGGGVIFSLTDSGINSNVAARIYARRDGSDTTGALQFWGGLDGTSELLTLRTSGSNLNTNLGINIADFGSQGGTSPNLRVSDDGSNPGVLDLYRNDNNISAGEIAGILQYSVKHDSDFAISSIEVETAGAAGTGKTGGGIMKFKTCTNNPGDVPVEAMRINEDGRVGIQVTDFSSNVSTPDLRVGSKAGLQNPGVIDIIRKDGAVVAGDDVGTLQFTVDDDSNYVVSQIKSITAADSGSGISGGGILTFNTSGQLTGNTPQERMRITQIGRVGINEDDPNSNLHVVGGQFDTYAAEFEGDVRIKDNFAKLTVEDTNTSTSTFALIEMKGKGVMGSNTAFLRTDHDGDFSISRNTASSSTSNFANTTLGNLISSSSSGSGNDSVFEATSSSGPGTDAVTMLFKANTDSQTGQYNEVGIEVDRMDGWPFSSTKRGKMRLQTGGNDHITMQTSVSEFGPFSSTTFHNISTFSNSITASAGIYVGGTGSDNHFDDYEEGSFTPSFTNSSGLGITYFSQLGSYVKTGRKVTCWGLISVNTVSYSSGSGTVGIDGLPFNAPLVSNQLGLIGNFNDDWAVDPSDFKIRKAGSNNDLIIFKEGGLGNNPVNMTGNYLASGILCNFSITYYTND